MRIAFLTPEYPHPDAPDGGLANYLVKVTSLLRDDGHQTHVFVLGPARDEAGVTWVPQATSVPWWMHGPMSRGQMAWRMQENSRALVRALIAQHNVRPFDIVQASSYGGVGWAAGGTLPIPLVVRISSFTPLLREAYGRRPTSGEIAADRIELEAIRKADAIFGPSRFMLDTLSRAEGVKGEWIPSPFIQPSGAEDSTLYDSELIGRRYLLFFGTLSRIKGVDLLVEALPPILSAHPELHAVYVGRDDGLPDGRTCREFIERHTSAFRTRTHILDRQPQPRLIPIIRNADFIVLPSRMDNYPNTCLEAQALGKIVVGTRGSSLDEMIDDGVTGFLAANGSIQSLRETIQRTLSLSESARDAMQAAIFDLRSQRNPVDKVTSLANFFERTISHFKVRGNPQ